MTAGKYRWMTVEEANRELKAGETVFYCASDYLEPCSGEWGGLIAGEYCVSVPGVEDWEYLDKRHRICRAIVPEVPTTCGDS